MAKLVLNDDGSVTMPLVPKEGRANELILPEPSMKQLARLHALATTADEKLPAFDQITEDASATDVARVQEQLKERTVIMFSDDSPHGHALIEMIALLTGEHVTEDDLYGWAMGPRTIRQILNHFQTPLPGPESVPGTPAIPGVNA